MQNTKVLPNRRPSVCTRLITVGPKRPVTPAVAPLPFAVAVRLPLPLTDAVAVLYVKLLRRRLKVEAVRQDTKSAPKLRAVLLLRRPFMAAIAVSLT